VLVWADDMPPYGTTVAPVLERRSRARPPRRVSAVDGVLRNGLLAVWHDAARGLCVAGEGIELADVLRFETVGDRGDLYTHSPVPGTRQEGRITRSRVTMRGPLRAELSLEAALPVAARELRSAAGERLVRQASRIRVQVRVQLDAGAPWCRVLVDGLNPAADHRTRIVFHTGCRHVSHLADAALGATWRTSTLPAPEPGDVEALPPTGPLHRYVSVFDHERGYGATVVSDGLAEYEAKPDGRLAITLLRATGELSRVDLPERPGHAGWPVPVPGAQSHGPFAAVFALALHALPTPGTLAHIEAMADDVLAPMTGVTIAPGAANQRVAGLSLEGQALGFLTCKRSEDGDAIIVRCVNLGGTAAVGAWHLPGLARAWLARLDETPLGALPVREDRVRFLMPPHAVSTIRLAR
jgi:alpha-mannosidase